MDLRKQLEDCSRLLAVCKFVEINENLRQVLVCYPEFVRFSQ